MYNFTIFGNPVEHSKSPQMHNAGFKNIKFNGNYTKTHLEDGTIVKNIFLQNNYKGANITVPHKIDAFNNADEVRGLAKQIGAVNTYIKEGNKVIAYNTDAPGFIKAINEFKDIKKVLLLGAGGTAKAIAVALLQENINLTILNRSTNNKDFFTKLKCKFYDWSDFKIETYDLIINSTSAGLKDDKYPIPFKLLESLIKSSTYAFDCIYGKMTPFLKIARDNNIVFKYGEDMLLFQGVLAFELFTGVKANRHLVEAMRRGLKSS